MRARDPMRVAARPDDVRALLSFAADHPVPDLPAGPERLLGTMVSGPGSIIDLGDADGRILVAALVDTCTNATDAAELLLVGARAGAPDVAQFTLLLDEAERSAAAGPRSSLEIALTPMVAPHAALLRRRGYAHAYDLCRMSVSLDGFTAATDPEWRDLDPSSVDAAHGLLLAAFAEVPGTGTPALAEFRRNAASSPAGSRRILVLDGVAAAYVHVIPPEVPGGAGDVNVIAREPRYRGRGVGGRALGEALRRLRAAGAAAARLEVVAMNRTALALYERQGFRVDTRQVVLGRRLRG